MGRNIYTEEFKVQLVDKYFEGKGSSVDLCAKYKIFGCDTLGK